MSRSTFVPLKGAPWRPASEVTDLVGQPMVPDREWFAMPPAEIGRVHAAWSTQTAGQKPFPLALKLILLLLTGMAFVAIAMALPKLLGARRSEGNMITVILCITVLPIALCIAAMVLWRKIYLWYVGDDGVAMIHHQGNHAATKSEVLKFSGTAQLRSSQTRQYYNGIYTGTEYDYRWETADGGRLLRLRGRYYRKKAGDTNTRYALALAAEQAWNKHFFARAQHELKTTGGVTFQVNKSDSVRVLPGALELNFKKQSMRVTPQEISKISLGDGWFTIHHKDATWLSRKGKFSFAYGQMANAQVFLMLMELLVGYRFS